MTEFKNYPGMKTNLMKYMGALAHEILNTFFDNNNVEPRWQDTNFIWGWFNESTGLWNGAIDLVSRT
jgi:hypothetical protein